MTSINRSSPFASSIMQSIHRKSLQPVDDFCSKRDAVILKGMIAGKSDCGNVAASPSH